FRPRRAHSAWWLPPPPLLPGVRPGAGSDFSRRALAARRNGAEFRGNDRVEDVDLLRPDDLEHPAGLLVRDDELHFDRQVAGELEKMLLVDDAVPAESGDRAERRAAPDPDPLGALEQPLVEQHAAVLAVLVHVEAQEGAFHRRASRARRTAPIPASVMSTDPMTCAPTSAIVQPYCWRVMSRVTVSAENVEKVVSPPRNPVVTSRRISAGSASKCDITPIATPMSSPPSRFAASVPRGSVGKTGLRRIPSHQRSHAPAAAPPPTATNPAQDTVTSHGFRALARRASPRPTPRRRPSSSSAAPPRRPSRAPRP